MATAVNQDLPTNNLTYRLLDEPAGAEIMNDGRFSWILTEQQGPGTHTFNVIVADGTAADSRRIVIAVNESGEVSEELTSPRPPSFPQPDQHGPHHLLCGNPWRRTNPPSHIFGNRCIRWLGRPRCIILYLTRLL